MAFYQDEDQLQDPNAPAPNTGGPSATLSQGSQAGAGQGNGPSQAPASSPGNAPDKPGNFVGIQQYINANRPQASKLAGNVGGFVTDIGNQAKSTLDTQKGAFNQAVNQNSVQLNQGLLDEAKADPTKVASDAAKKAEFQKMRDAQYAGPASFEGSEFYQPAQQSVAKAQQAADNTKTVEGQRNLLSDLQKTQKGKVNQGALDFDSLLLQAAPEARSTLEGVRNAQTDLGNQFNAFTQEGNALAKNAAAQTAAAKSAVNQAFAGPQGVQGQLEQALNERAQGAAMDNDWFNQKAVQDFLSGGKVTDEALKRIGATREQANQVGALNKGGALINPDAAKNYYTMNPLANQVNAQNVASAEDYARYQALNDLMGNTGSLLTDPSQAGKANYDNIDFDVNRFLADLTAKQPRTLQQAANSMGLSGVNSQQAQKNNMGISHNDPTMPDGSPNPAYVASNTVNAFNDFFKNLAGVRK